MSTRQSLTSPAEVQETTMMLMQPNANWEEYLAPAPLAIVIMAEFVFISSRTDFSINKNPPEGGFKYIRYPESFRASLTQVANLGWHAFNEADKNMDRIRIHTATVPGYMKEASKILFHGSNDVIEALLPNQLENIRTIADECVTLASNVEKKYSDVIKLILELLEGCVNAEHFYGEELEKVKMKLEETKIRENTAQELKEWSKKAMEAMSKQSGEAQHGYKEVMNSLPSGWDVTGMDFLQGFKSTATTLLHGVTAVFSAPLTAFFSAGGAPTNHDIKNKMVDIVTLNKVYSKSGEILRLAHHLNQFVNKPEIDWNELYDQKKKNTKTTWTQSKFKTISEDLGKMAVSELRERALSLCKRGISICNDLAKCSLKKPLDEGMTTQLIEKVQWLYDDALTFDQQSKATLGSTVKPQKLHGDTYIMATSSSADQKENCMNTNWHQSEFERISKEWRKMNKGELRKHALSLCKRGISICDDLAKYSPETTWDEGVAEQLIEKVQRLHDDAFALDQQSKATLGSPALETKPPNLSEAERTSSGGSASQRGAENTRYQIEVSQDQLKQAREDYQKSVENMQKNQKALNEILVELQNCNIKEIDFGTIIMMLVKALDAIGRVKEQWDEMVCFFQMLSGLVHVSLNRTLPYFVTTSNATRKLSYDGKLFAKDLLDNQASNIASLVHKISGTYSEVSKKYLVDRVSSLGKLIAMDKEKPEFMQERLNLQQSCKEAQEGILQLVLKNKKV